MAEWSNAAVLKTVDLNGSGGSNPSLSANKLKLSALRWAFFVQGRREPRSCKALQRKKAQKAIKPWGLNLFSTAPPRRRWGMWRTQCGKSRNENHLRVVSQMTVTFQYPVLRLPIRSRYPDFFRNAISRLIVPSDNSVFSHILSLLRLLSSANICKIRLRILVKFIGPLIGSLIGSFSGRYRTRNQ